ncbi:sigma-70 family RNA polymerase sigma factor [Actinoplanes sp. NPDC026619]|uniref:RNA polymerase sigma factor n=1 Tax=Actinoplanes sp. NPDC026619 TaxID=3155798 RepID=UPI00340E197E
MRSPEALVPVERVRAAQRGDRAALEQLIADHLTMLYNVAGRALGGHADVDDVVQETLLRVVENISAVRDPARFSGWILAIVHRQVAERIRRRQAVTARTSSLEAASEVADPGADFADATILRLGLSGQRRQVVEAVRWLDPGDRFLLSLWWLEVAGTIGRADLVTALGTGAGHAAVRIKRMRDQLELSRCIVGALDAEPRCPQLAEVVQIWDGNPGPVWRKRLGRHLRDCRICPADGRRLAPPEALLAGLAMLPLPASLAACSVPTAIVAAGVPAVAGGGLLGASVLAKVAVAAVGAVVVSGATVAALQQGSGTPRAVAPPPAVTASATPGASPRPASPSPVVAGAPAVRYGSVVDTADAAPPEDREPGRLPARPEGTLAVVASGDNDPRAEVVSLIRRGQWVTYRGRGYLRIEFSAAYTQRAGAIALPSWTGLRGRLFHVASGGGRRLDDQIPDAAEGTTGMGDATHGHAVLPAGAQQMWHFEYYYLDGQVTFTSNERGADYNLYVHLADRASIDADIRTAPGPDVAPIRYGLARDDGTDACPVPQYATRATPADPAVVPQKSNLR